MGISVSPGEPRVHGTCRRRMTGGECVKNSDKRGRLRRGRCAPFLHVVHVSKGRVLGKECGPGGYNLLKKRHSSLARRAVRARHVPEANGRRRTCKEFRQSWAAAMGPLRAILARRTRTTFHSRPSGPPPGMHRRPGPAARVPCRSRDPRARSLDSERLSIHSKQSIRQMGADTLYMDLAIPTEPRAREETTPWPQT